jgi:dihydroflavonol-4-reductase
MMRVLVTGGTGQIGGAIAKALVQRGDTVRALVRDAGRPGHLADLDLELHQGDVTQAESLESACVGIDAVIHSAGCISYWKKGHARMNAVNVEGTRNMLESATRAGVGRFVHTSSMACFGYVDGDGIGDERTQYNWGPLNIGYCDSKKAAEDLVLGWTDMPCIAVNPGITLGEGDVNGNGVRLLVQLKAGKIKGIPPGHTTLCCLTDIVAGHLAALEKGRIGERYHLGGHPMSWEAVFQMAAKVVDAPPPPRKVSRGLMMTMARLQMLGGWCTGVEPKITAQVVEISSRNRMYDCSKAQEELGYSISDLENSINLAWDWYQRAHLG